MSNMSSTAIMLLKMQLFALQGSDTETNGKRTALMIQIAELENQETLIELSKSPEQRAAEAATRAAEAAKNAKNMPIGCLIIFILVCAMVFLLWMVERIDKERKERNVSMTLRQLRNEFGQNPLATHN